MSASAAGPKRLGPQLACALLCTATAACDDAPSFLDPEHIHDIARQPGNARGEAFSGHYQVQWTTAECGCPGALETSGVDSCTLDDVFLVPFELVQSDGYVRFWIGAYDLYGGIDANGTFESGALASGTTFGARGRLTAYFAGQISRDDEGSLLLEAELLQRLDGEILFGEYAGAIDCINRYALEGRQTLVF